MSETAAATHHEFTAGGDGWIWRIGSAVVQSADGDTRLILPGISRSAEAAEAFVHGYIEGQRHGRRWGNAEGEERVRSELRRLLGAADSESTHKRLCALEGE